MPNISGFCLKLLKLHFLVEVGDTETTKRFDRVIFEGALRVRSVTKWVHRTPFRQWSPCPKNQDFLQVQGPSETWYKRPHLVLVLHDRTQSIEVRKTCKDYFTSSDPYHDISIICFHTMVRSMLPWVLVVFDIADPPVCSFHVRECASRSPVVASKKCCDQRDRYSSIT